MDRHPADKCSSSPDCEDGACGNGARNRYYMGKRLSPESFQTEQDYLIGRRRLINRTLHGAGVASGYAIAPGSGRYAFTVSAGLALDPLGRELAQSCDARIGAAAVIVFDRDGRVLKSDDARRIARDGPCAGVKCWLLSVHYAEREIDRVNGGGKCGGLQVEHDRVCETVGYSVRPVTEDAPCDTGSGLSCRCAPQSCGCAGDVKPDDETVADRGGGRCICDHITQLPQRAAKPCDWRDGDCLAVDLRNSIPLAHVTIEDDKCGAWFVSRVTDGCGPRPLVVNSMLLFDLIRGRDLTRIDEIGWAEFHRSTADIAFDRFRDSFSPSAEDRDTKAEAAAAGDKGAGEPAAKHMAAGKYWVSFTGPVRVSSLRADCFAMRILFTEDEGGWWQEYRIPVVYVLADPPLPGDPADTTRKAALAVNQDWLADAVFGARTFFQHRRAIVEIEVRGDLITDCNGQSVDANARGLSSKSFGNGTPGGTLLSAFAVAAKQPLRPDSK